MTIRRRSWRFVRTTGHIRIGKIACMSTAEVVDMSAARANVLHMPKMIQVRNVPDEMHVALKVKAAEEGMSLSDYIKKELSYVAGKSSIEEMADRRRRRKGRKPSRLKTETTVQIIREARGE